MKAIRARFTGRRGQQGSVLSGVLIITAFIAIISGALMTELSTNVIVSNALQNRLADQATVNSAFERALDGLENSSVNAGCPDLTAMTVSINSRQATANYVSCWPTYREKTYPAIARGSSASIAIDGFHGVVRGQDLYAVADAAGNVYEYPFGSTSPVYGWPLQVPSGGQVSGPPFVFPDLGYGQTDANVMVPLSFSSNPRPSACQAGCVTLISQDSGSTPIVECYMAALGRVTARPAVGVNNGTVAFFGDQSGAVFAYANTEAGACSQLASISGSRVVAGPVVLANPGNSSLDELFVVTSEPDGDSTRLVRYEYNGSARTLQAVGSWALSSSQVVVVGLALDSSQARLAITFSDGTVNLAQIQGNFTVATPIPQKQVGHPITGAAAFCCSPTRIGIAWSSGLLVLDSNLNQVAQFQTGGATLMSGPIPDAAGDWFIGASDGNFYYAPAIPNGTAMLSLGSGTLGQIASSIQVGSCGSWICLYVGSRNGGIYRVTLDARDAVLTACVTTSSSTCPPMLWSSVEVGSTASQREVHIQGWAYYSG